MESLAVRQHYIQLYDVLPHPAVPDGSCATGVGRCHATQRCVSAGVYREEEAAILKSAIQLLARDTWFDCYQEILGAYIQDTVHSGEIEANYRCDGSHMLCDGGPGAVWSQRHMLCTARG